MTASNQDSKPAQPDQLRVIIIGAGLGGCAAAIAMHYQGFHVIHLERLRNFSRLGDSLGLGENALRLLKRWGLHSQLLAIGNKSPTMNIRRWDTGAILATQPLMDMAGYIGHRGDYHAAFLGRVAELGIEVRMGHKVVAFSDEPGKLPSVTVERRVGEEEDALETEEFEADIVIGADGIKSATRELVLGFTDTPKSSGYACYRAFFDGKEVKADPRCASYAQKDCVNIWIGPDMHLVQNTLRDGREFNWILTHKDDGEIEESWFQPGNMTDVLKLVEGWDPEIVAAVEKTPSCLDWKICYRDPISSWVSVRSHNIVLLGDSCHPHLPTSAQGASQAVESAAVLALCLTLSKGNIPLATRVYERLRSPRTMQSQLNGEDVRDRWHNALKEDTAGKVINPDDVKIKNRWLYPFDAEADTRERWEEVSKVVLEELRANKVKPLVNERMKVVDEFDADGRRKVAVEMGIVVGAEVKVGG